MPDDLMMLMKQTMDKVNEVLNGSAKGIHTLDEPGLRLLEKEILKNPLVASVQIITDRQMQEMEKNENY